MEQDELIIYLNRAYLDRKVPKVIVVLMGYLAALGNVSVLSLLFNIIDCFPYNSAGRDGVKGDKGDSGRHGKKE